MCSTVILKFVKDTKCEMRETNVNLIIFSGKNMYDKVWQKKMHHLHWCLKAKKLPGCSEKKKKEGRCIAVQS